MASSSGENKWATWAVIGTTATVAVAGLTYLAYSAWSDYHGDELSLANKKKADEAAVRLRIAKGIQMQSLAPAPGPKLSASATPTLPIRPTPKANGTGNAAAPGPAAATAKATGAGPSSNSRKTCAQCTKATSGLPLRCSGCKQVYYCSQECQRKAWPDHKSSCKSNTTTPGNSTGGASTSNTPSSQPLVPAEAPEVINSDEQPKDFQQALAMYLEQTAASKTDQLEASFETAVMLFVKGEYRAAITSLEKVQELAKERQDNAVMGEVYKWMGHAHNRLAATATAQTMFELGCAHAKQHKLTRLEIDCLGGLGCMYRAQNNSTKAVELLEEALVLAEAGKDDDSRASTLCNLGAALVPVDAAKALNCLHEAVTIREAAIERLHDAGERNGLATAVMEHANALVNLASALLVTKKLENAEACYIRALEVFELVEDVDKVLKVLINLANMKELQVNTAKSHEEACEYRKRLVQFMMSHGVRRVDSACSICLEPFDMQAVSKSGQELILLSCMHCLHNKCWEQWAGKNTSEQGVTCPSCKQPVPLFES